MQALTCPRCGANLPPGAQGTLVRCGSCGAQVAPATPAPRTPPLDWKVSAAHPDGRLFVSDGCLLIDIRWVPCPAIPELDPMLLDSDGWIIGALMPRSG